MPKCALVATRPGPSLTSFTSNSFFLRDSSGCRAADVSDIKLVLLERASWSSDRQARSITNQLYIRWLLLEKAAERLPLSRNDVKVVLEWVLNLQVCSWTAGVHGGT